MEKESSFLKENIKDKTSYFLNDAKDLIFNWKKNSDSMLEEEEFRQLSENDPQEAQKRKENKFRKNYFNNITSDLAAAKLGLQDETLDTLWKELNVLNMEIADSLKVEESQIDSFDKLALKIIEAIESLKN